MSKRKAAATLNSVTSVAEPLPKRAKKMESKASGKEAKKAPVPGTPAEPVKPVAEMMMESKTLEDKEQQQLTNDTADEFGMSSAQKRAVEYHDGCGVKGCCLSHRGDPHEQKEASHPLVEDKIPVDNGLKKLLEAIWNEGISTNLSCEHNDGEAGQSGQHYVWIEFSAAADAEQFINRVVAGNVTDNDRKSTLTDTLYNRITKCSNDDEDMMPTPWKFACFTSDDNTFNDPETEDGQNELFGPPIISLPIGIRFPHRDFEAVCFAFGIE